jgi:membrane peptidoglycan carboxypeptidase
MDGLVTAGVDHPRAASRGEAAQDQAADAERQEDPGDQTEYLLGMVREEADKYGIKLQELQRGGYRIKTTFNSAMVNQAQRSVVGVLGPYRFWPRNTQVALVTVDATNGQVVSIYAGNGQRQNNGVTQDIAQAGSTFKPFTLIAALEGERELGNCDPQPPGEKSLSLRSRVDGRSPQTFKGLKAPVFNDEGEGSLGEIDLVKATAESVNTAYVRLNEMARPEHTLAVAACAGFPAQGPGRTQGLDGGLNNVLGVSSPHPIDMARAYATIASGASTTTPTSSRACATPPAERSSPRTRVRASGCSTRA